MNTYSYNLQTFYNEDAISYYLLGAFMTDGNVYVRANQNKPNSKVVSISSKDEDWIEIINSYICPESQIIKKGNCSSVRYFSSELGDWFESKGCGPNKSLTLEMPNVPEHYMRDFIRGCWDGDGSLSFTQRSKTGNSFKMNGHLTSGSKLFCEKLSKIINNLGIYCTLEQHDSPERKIEGRILQPSTAWRVVIGAQTSIYDLCKYLYTHQDISMPRKLQIANKIINFRENSTNPIMKKNLREK